MLRRLLIYLCLGWLLLITGCWDGLRLEQRNIVIAMGIDPGPDGLYKFTFTNPVLEAAEVAPERVQRITTIASSIGEALDNLNKVSDRRASVGQLRTILFNEEVVRQRGIKRFIDDINANPLFPPITNLVVVQGNCQQLLNSQFKDKSRIAFYINGVILNATQRHDIKKSELLLLNSQLMDPLAIVMLPYITYGREEVKVAGQAVIKSNRMITTINTFQSGLSQIITGRAREFVFTVHQGPQNSITLRVLRNKTEKKWHWQDDVPVFDIKNHLSLDIISAYNQQRVTDEQSLLRAENEVAAFLSKEYRRLTALSQEKNLDIYQLGKLLRQSLGREMDPRWWEETYPRARITIQPTVHIRRVGRTI
ncbi:Ger(x)C family spore germination protein [Desulfurispora thermophila]|uniref:Ger(x)C family spore germination protein n=1 Tax=Desulfurispora thermophila TaxID=265470 RepID=UPI00038086BC|nr:Ger(x)C family spore germination protein [Desulfurispora thermophila]